MIITWLNADGNVTLSQRTTPREVMPTVDPSPPRVATLSTALTSVCTESSCPATLFTDYFADIGLNFKLRLHNPCMYSIAFSLSST
jgi:hypothetical protein